MSILETASSRGRAALLPLLSLCAAATAAPLMPAPAGPEGRIRVDPSRLVMLSWRQQELRPGNTNEPARYFLLCVHETFGGDCASTPMRWMQSASTILRVAVTRPATSASSAVTAYDYAFPFVVPPLMLDQFLSWQVGACATEQEDSCSMVATELFASERNLQAFDIRATRLSSALLSVTGEIRNAGTVDSGLLSITLRTYLAIGDESGRCITDVNVENLDTERGWLLTSEGMRVPLRELSRDANGRLDASRYRVVAVVESPVAISADHLGTTVSAGASATVQAIVDLSAQQLPAAFASVLGVRSNGDEYDLADNARGECHSADRM